MKVAQISDENRSLVIWKDSQREKMRQALHLTVLLVKAFYYDH